MPPIQARTPSLHLQLQGLQSTVRQRRWCPPTTCRGPPPPARQLPHPVCFWQSKPPLREARSMTLPERSQLRAQLAVCYVGVAGSAVIVAVSCVAWLGHPLGQAGGLFSPVDSLWRHGAGTWQRLQQASKEALEHEAASAVPAPAEYWRRRQQNSGAPSLSMKASAIAKHLTHLTVDGAPLASGRLTLHAV